MCITPGSLISEDTGLYLAYGCRLMWELTQIEGKSRDAPIAAFVFLYFRRKLSSKNLTSNFLVCCLKIVIRMKKTTTRNIDEISW